MNVMFNRIGAKINHYATRGARLGKKVAGHVKRLEEKVLPLAKGVLGLVQAAGEGGTIKWSGNS